MVFFQVPAIRISVPDVCWQRRLKPGEVTRFHVESDWTTANGKTHYDYDMTLQAERPVKKKVELVTVAKLSNLSEEYDQADAPARTVRRSKSFGAIPMNLSAGGPPKDIGAGGAITAFAMPLMALTLPADGPDDSGHFPVARFRVEPLGSFTGKGFFGGLKRGEYRVSVDLKMGDEPGAATLTATSWFFLFSGALSTSEGTYTDSTGTLTFKIERP